MGIIILPFLLGAFGLSVFALVRCIKLFRNKKINGKEIVFGLAISATLFGLICLSYLMEGRAWALSPAFRIPIYMVFLPFGFYLVTRSSKNQKLTYAATLTLISIAFTGVLGILFSDLLFELIDRLGIEKYY